MIVFPKVRNIKTTQNVKATQNVKPQGFVKPFEFKSGTFQGKPALVPPSNFRKSFETFSPGFTTLRHFSTGTEPSPEAEPTSDEVAYPDVYSEEGLEGLIGLAGALPEEALESLRRSEKAEPPSGTKTVEPLTGEILPTTSDVSTLSEQQTAKVPSLPSIGLRRLDVLSDFITGLAEGVIGSLFGGGGGGSSGYEQDQEELGKQYVFEKTLEEDEAKKRRAAKKGEDRR